MKMYAGFFLIISLSCISNAQTLDAEAVAWIEEGFVKLKPAEQRNFLIELQTALVSLNGSFELFSRRPVFELNSILQNLLLPQCQAASTTAFRDSIRVTESTAATWTGASEDYAQLFKKTGQIKYATSALSNLIAEAHRLQGSRDVAAQLRLKKQFIDLKSQLTADAKRHGVHSSISNMMYNQESIFQRITAEAAPVSPQVVKAKTAVVALQGKKIVATNTVVPKTEDEFSACLYAGFIIHGPVCKAPRELPVSDQIRDFFNAEKFRCTTAQVICNPLIFGFEAACNDTKPEKVFRSCLNDARPICIANSVSATADCKAKTNNERYSESALSLVKAKPALFAKLVKDSLTLCDEKNMATNKMIYQNANGSPRKNAERIRNDIVQTCLVARPQINLILKKYEQLSKNDVVKSLDSTQQAGSKK